MLYQPPFVPGATPGVTGIFNANPDASYINGDPTTGTEGSYFPNAAIEHPQRELIKVLTSAGITPSVAVLEQLAEGIARYASYATGGTFAGTNTITVAKYGSVVVPKALFTGMRVRGRAAATNTGATTADVFGLGAKKVLNWLGLALTGGELYIGRPTEWEYDATLDAGAGAWRIMPWAMAPIKWSSATNSSSQSMSNGVLTSLNPGTGTFIGVGGISGNLFTFTRHGLYGVSFDSAIQVNITGANRFEAKTTLHHSGAPAAGGTVGDVGYATLTGSYPFVQSVTTFIQAVEGSTLELKGYAAGYTDATGGSCTSCGMSIWPIT